MIRITILAILTISCGCSSTHPMFQDFNMAISRSHLREYDSICKEVNERNKQRMLDADAAQKDTIAFDKITCELNDWAIIAPVTVFAPLVSLTGESIAFAKAFD